MVNVQMGAIKFNSIRDMAKSVAAKTGEPENRVYMRLYMRMRAGAKPGTAFQKKARKYSMNDNTNNQTIN